MSGGSTRRRWQRFVLSALQLVGILRYGIAFGLSIVLLPLTALSGAPLNGILGGMFSGLTGMGIAAVVAALLLACWSVMFAQAVVFEGLAEREREEARPPAWADDFFGLPVTSGQFALFTALALPAVWIGASRAQAGLAGAAGGVAGGALAALGLVILACLPFALSEPDGADDRQLRGLAMGFLLRRAREVGWLRRATLAVRAVISWPLAFVGADHVLETAVFEGRERHLVKPEHYLAITCAGSLTLAILVLVRLVVPPYGPDDVRVSAAASLFVMLAASAWVIGALDYHLSRARFSPLLGLALVVVAAYGIGRMEHTFEVRAAAPDLRAAATLTPLDVAAQAAAPGASGNLVVVTATGGGIQSAGWTSLALANLLRARPALARELRLASGVSGGSVGIAFLLANLVDAGEPSTGGVADQRLARAVAQATASSLDAVAYGFAFVDLPRALTGGILPWRSKHLDRGYYLERQWAANAGGASLTVRGLSAPIRDGRLPAPILNATTLEEGARVMITPITFASAGRKRARTLFERLADDGADLDLWTAARVSASFPYVTPVTRPRRGDAPIAGQPHLGDGGYFDNFGVASAIDFLEPVLEAIERGEAGFQLERVLLVQLRAFPEGAGFEPMPGWQGAVLGPLTGLLEIWSASARSRNEIELDRWIASWNARFAPDSTGSEGSEGAAAPRRGPRLATVVFEPASDEDGPLSWHLTRKELAALRAGWFASAEPRQGRPEDDVAFWLGDPETWQPTVIDAWEEMLRFLDG